MEEKISRENRMVQAQFDMIEITGRIPERLKIF